MQHKIENGQCVYCKQTHGDIVTKNIECHIPLFPERRRSIKLTGEPTRCTGKFDIIPCDGEGKPLK